MKTIVLASQKGGAGKTTLAAHLAVVAEQEGAGPAVLIDTDPQGSLSAWWNAREADAPALASTSLADLPAKLQALASAGFKLAVIDTPPAITAAIRDVVRLADLVLIPTRPSPHDLRAVGSTVEHCPGDRSAVRLRRHPGQADSPPYGASRGGLVGAWSGRPFHRA